MVSQSSGFSASSLFYLSLVHRLLASLSFPQTCPSSWICHLSRWHSFPHRHFPILSSLCIQTDTNTCVFYLHPNHPSRISPHFLPVCPNWPSPLLISSLLIVLCFLGPSHPSATLPCLNSLNASYHFSSMVVTQHGARITRGTFKTTDA